MTAASHASDDRKFALDVYQNTATGEYVAMYPEVRITGEKPVNTGNAPTTLTAFDRITPSGVRWAPWGDDDLVPTNLRCKLEEVPMAQSAVSRLAAMMYGNGIVYYKNSDIDNGEVKRARIPEIEAFMRRSRINTKWFLAQCLDFRYSMNAFSEFILSNDRTKIVSIFHKQAEFCRKSVQNEETLDIDWLLYSADFPLGGVGQNRYAFIPLYSYFDDLKEYVSRLKGHKFAYHAHYPTPGTVYYARPMWVGLFRKEGWLDVAANVPRIISAMQNNQISIKYQIVIPETYFEIRYREWDMFTAEQREKAMDDLVVRVNESLKGATNVYNSITTFVKQDKVSGAMIGKIEILPIDDKTKAGTWVPDSNAADAQIVQALGLHPSQMGLQPAGGKMGAGSGSDQRESFNTGISLNTPDQDLLLEPLQMVAEFNGWDVTFAIDHTMHTTTNEKEDGMKPGPLSTEVKNPEKSST
jgi:hypothetical protein